MLFQAKLFFICRFLPGYKVIELTFPNTKTVFQSLPQRTSSLTLATKSADNMANRRKGGGDNLSRSGAKKSKKSDSDSDPLTAAGGFPYLDAELFPYWMNSERCRLLTPKVTKPREAQPNEHSCIIYWMQRDMRTQDNWAMLLAQHLASESKVPMRVLFCLPPPYTISPKPNFDDNTAKYPHMTERHGIFLLGGLKCVQNECQRLNIPFDVICPSSTNEDGNQLELKSSVAMDLANYAASPKHKALAVVTDQSPLRHIRKWTELEAVDAFHNHPELSEVPLYQVDAHNVVPVWFASDKKEVGARTLRPKIDKNLSKFMTIYPTLKGNAHIKDNLIPDNKNVNWKKCEVFLQMDPSVASVPWAEPGTGGGLKQLNKFLSQGLKTFDQERNNPTLSHVCSSLSPWTNYGHLSFQAVALKVRHLEKWFEAKAAFIEEGIVRRELSDNFLFYNRDGYDTIEGGAAEWAKESLRLHEQDEREYLYTIEEFEQGQTHDDLWNAAQIQLVQTGKMHGFVSVLVAFYFCSFMTTIKY